jgi:hypothetical protein
MDTSPSIDAILEQAEQLSFEEKLLLLEKLAQALRAHPKPNEPRQRIAGLHEGMGWMADDFDAPLNSAFDAS